jgi:hypothetical protein
MWRPKLAAVADVNFASLWKGWIGVDRQIGRATRRPSTGVQHHYCELHERIATQFVNGQLKIILVYLLKNVRGY